MDESFWWIFLILFAFRMECGFVGACGGALVGAALSISCAVASGDLLTLPTYLDAIMRCSAIGAAVIPFRNPKPPSPPMA
jgi:hypothetical protein